MEIVFYADGTIRAEVSADEHVPCGYHADQGTVLPGDQSRLALAQGVD
jgi:hypothetical protein